MTLGPRDVRAGLEVVRARRRRDGRAAVPGRARRARLERRRGRGDGGRHRARDERGGLLLHPARPRQLGGRRCHTSRSTSWSETYAARPVATEPVLTMTSCGAFAATRGVERRLRVVLDPQLDRLRELRPTDPRQQRRHVDPGRDAGGGVITLPCSTTRSVDGMAPSSASRSERHPVRSSPGKPVEDPGGAEDQRAGADRGRVFRVLDGRARARPMISSSIRSRVP